MREEHDGLRRGASQLRRLAEGGACACGSASTCGCLAVALEGFRGQLRRHFESEERAWAGGDNADWTSRRRIEALLREHHDLQQRLAQVSSGLQDLADRGATPTLAQEVCGVLDDLFRHELSETGLFQRRLSEGGLELG